MKNSRSYRVLAAGLAVLVGLVVQQSSVAAASLTAKVQVNISATLSNPLDLTTASAPLSMQRTLILSSGTGGNQANVVWSDTRTLAASGTENLDLAGGGLTDAFGATVGPARLRTIFVSASCGNTNNVVLGGDANSVPFLSAAATTITIPPCGVFLLTSPSAAGIVVTAGTGDIIKVLNGAAGTSVTYDILLLGTTS